MRVLPLRTQNVLVSEPHPSHGEEEGSGHHLTFESPGQNVDLKNQKR